ncbi:MAG TPA: ATP-binding protein, partial [Blastocatellia bacterium]
DERDLRMLDLLARQAADLIERAQAENERRKLLEREHAARAEAEAASLSKDQFLATVSHELRTPLNAMLGWARMLRGGILDQEISRQAVETIERNAQVQARLIEDLLDVSRIVSGKMRLEVAGIDLVAVIEAAVDSMRPAVDAKEIRLQVVVPPQPELIVADANRLQQVVWNLLSNAIKFTPKGGWVRVLLVHTDAEVEILVSDSGKGIPAGFLPYVFDRFRQGDSTLARAQRGLGLGLAIVRHLVELHGGSVRAESAGEDRGATFIVKLPVTAAPVTTAVEPSVKSPEYSNAFEKPAALEGLRILVVDDDPDGRTMLGAILEHCKAEVTTAASSAEAMQVLDWSQPDVIVSDIEMPGEDGYYLIREIRSREATSRVPPVPALAVTAHAGPDDRLRALSAGYQTHIAKPFDPVELVTAIESLVMGKVATH